MSLNIVEIIEKKAQNQVLSQAEIRFVIEHYLSGTIQDYQMSALLMAISLRGLNHDEIIYLTTAMVNSGEIYDLSAIPGIKVDKHSTGGVGDKMSLIIAPLAAALNIKVAKMSGRGLGHTGGTIDKLETIPGFHTNLTKTQLIQQVCEHNIAIMSQSDTVAKADKKIYALRDVTGTVNSKELIASSIMAKKVATGSDAILIDLKCGSGAFMQTLPEAQALANLLIALGHYYHKDVRVKITSMNNVLGRMIGNKNEVLEALQVLANQGESDLVALTYNIMITMLAQAKITDDPAVATKMIQTALTNKSALAKFYQWVKLQGGNVAVIQASNFWNPRFQKPLIAPHSGYLRIKSIKTLGMVAMHLGAGRKVKTDQIDVEAGIYLNKKQTEYVTAGEPFCTLYANTPIDDELVNLIYTTTEFLPTASLNEPLIIAENC